MIEAIEKIKKVKDPKVENQKFINKHKKAALHHETAAKYHHEAAKYHKGGNSIMACNSISKAKNESDLALKTQKKILKKMLL
jgi:hypothetical protein